MSTATAPRQRTQYRQQTRETLSATIGAARQSYPGLSEARAKLAQLQSDERDLLAKLKIAPTAEDPHIHESVRIKLAAVREKIGPAQQAEKNAELEASKSALPLFIPRHKEVAAEFVQSLAASVEAFEKLYELRNVATGHQLPLNRETPFYGLEQFQSLKQQLKLILSHWQQ